VDPEGAEMAAIGAAVPLASCRLLEVGCGAGRLTTELLAVGARVDAVEQVPALLAKARRRCAGQGGRFLRGIPKAKARYDAVLFSHSL
jgi:16S rRNA A1518/A1519 N6-dimethyltransferase RsmA/KsgA/DIM1 with predicted DNA glycosylase/AP lyase activity